MYKRSYRYLVAQANQAIIVINVHYRAFHLGRRRFFSISNQNFMAHGRQAQRYYNSLRNVTSNTFWFFSSYSSSRKNDRSYSQQGNSRKSHKRPGVGERDTRYILLHLAQFAVRKLRSNRYKIQISITASAGWQRSCHRFDLAHYQQTRGFL